MFPTVNHRYHRRTTWRIFKSLLIILGCFQFSIQERNAFITISTNQRKIYSSLSLASTPRGLFFSGISRSSKHVLRNPRNSSNRGPSVFSDKNLTKYLNTGICGTKLSHIPAPREWLKSSGHVLNGKGAYKRLYEESISNPNTFYAREGQRYYWSKPFNENDVFSYNFNRTRGPIYTKFFSGGYTNIAYNCLDRHVAAGIGDRVAFFVESNDPNENENQEHKIKWTYSEVMDEVNRLANSMRKLGIKKGDRVIIFMAHAPENCMAMLACAKIGAIHSVVFGGFSPESLSARIDDSRAKLVITQDGVMRGDKMIALKSIADKAVDMASHKVDSMVVYKRLGSAHGCDNSYTWNASRDIWWDQITKRMSPKCLVEFVDAEHPLFILYTSGSTGKPKGICHSTGGYMVHAGMTFKYSFDYCNAQKDVFFCTADCGWITGHTYATYGPLLNGASQVIFEGVPSFPNPSRLWEICDKYQVTHLYTAPTAIRALMGAGDDFVRSTSRSSLKMLGTVGEPINPEAWRWYYQVVGDGRCPVIDTWWQTETGGHLLVPMPSNNPEDFVLKPGSVQKPMFGALPVLLDPVTGIEINDAVAEGILAFKKPWPSILRSVWGDAKRFEETYFTYPGYYLTGDGARRDADGDYWITGRVDDVVIVSGHNIGTAEVESAAVLHPKVAEAAAVGVEHPIKGQCLYVFIWLKQGNVPSDTLVEELRQQVKKSIGSFAVPDVFQFAKQGLPKTRSGKIMRRILRKIATFGVRVKLEDLGDLSTLADPFVVDDLISTSSTSRYSSKKM